MKETLFTLFFLASLHRLTIAQGTIEFYNHNVRDVNGGVYSARVTLPNGSYVADDSVTAGLFLVREGSLELLATSPFYNRGLFKPLIVEVPGIPWGQPATVRVRVWETSAGSYENAITTGMLYGEFPTGQPNNDLLLPRLGGDPFGVILPAQLDGIQPFTLVPEPTTCALLALGGFLCFSLFKRK